MNARQKEIKYINGFFLFLIICFIIGVIICMGADFARGGVVNTDLFKSETPNQIEPVLATDTVLAGINKISGTHAFLIIGNDTVYLGSAASDKDVVMYFTNAADTGAIRYNGTDNQMEYSNDGGSSWTAIGSGGGESDTVYVDSGDGTQYSNINDRITIKEGTAIDISIEGDTTAYTIIYINLDTAWLNTYWKIASASSADYADSAGSSADEKVQDKVGGMFSGNTEVGLAVFYDDQNGKIDLFINPDGTTLDTVGGVVLYVKDGGISGAKMTTALHDSLVNGATAYGWGDHSVAGYLTSETGDIEGVTAGVAMSGGGTSGTVTLNTDTMIVATRDYVNDAALIVTDIHAQGDVSATGQFLTYSEMNRLDTTYLKAERAASKLKIWHKKFGAESDTNQMIHPSVVAAPESFGPDAGDTLIAYNSAGSLDTIIASAGTPKWKYWLAGTPYPGSNGAAENPHMRVANRPDGDVDSNKFIPPYGIGTDPTDGDAVDTVWVRDPIFDSTYLEYPDSASHLSDPELIFSKEGDLWCIFRFSYVKNDSNHEVIMGVPSTDGITWRIADSSYLMYYPDTGIFTDVVCPQLILDTAGSYKMYFTDIVYQHLTIPDQDDSNVVVMVSAPDIDSMFGNAVICTVSAPTNILDPWHFDIKRRGSQYDMFMAFSDTLNSHIHCDSGLYYYQSDNGINFTIKNAMFLRKSTITTLWDYKMFYKPEALWINDGDGGYYGLWYSALSNTSTWGTGYTKIRNDDTTFMRATPGDTTSGAYLFSGTVKFTGTVQRGIASIGDSAFATLDYVKFHDTGTVSLLILNPELSTDTTPIFYCDSAKYPYGITIQSLNCQTDADGAYVLKFFIYNATDPPTLHDYIDTLNIGASDQRASSVTFEDSNANDVAVGQFVYILTPTDDKGWLRVSFRFTRKKS